MRTLGNIIWIICGGFYLALFWLFLGLFFCLTVIGIPFGKQCFKAAALTFAPFGKSVDTNFGKHPIANLIFAIFFGWELALGFFLAGIVNCLTVIGIPLGIQAIKLAKLAIFPFGAKIKN